MNPRLYIFFWLINPWRKKWTYVLKYDVNLLNKCFDHFSNLIKFWFSERNTENAMSDIYFNGEIDYSEENTSDNEDFRSTIFQRLQFEPEQKKMWCKESHEKETKDIHVSDVDLLHINRKSRPVQMWTLQKRSEIALVVERWMQSLLLWLKLWGVREVSHHPVFMGNCRTIKPYRPSRSVLLFIPGIAEQN